MAENKSVSQLWIEHTGTPWAEAKSRGLTDGTKEGNEKLKQRLLKEYKQSGGEIDNQGIQEEVIRSLQKGVDPQSIIERLIELGVDQGEAQMFVQEMMQVLQQQRQEFQEGGEMQNEVLDAVAQALQEGTEPEEIVAFLVEQGLPEEEAIQVVQAVMQQLQSQGQPEQAPQFQQGGEVEQLMQGVITALQGQEDPEELVAYLIEQGMPEEQAIQTVEQAIQMLTQ